MSENEIDRDAVAQEIAEKCIVQLDGRDALLKLLPRELVAEHCQALAKALASDYGAGFVNTNALMSLISIADWPRRRDDEDAYQAWLREARLSIATNTKDRRRFAWREYAAHALTSGSNTAQAAAEADDILAEEEKRFGTLEAS